MTDDRWHRQFMALAELTAKMSKDPSIQVGAVIVRDRVALSMGFNGFPQGIQDRKEWLENRQLKYALTIHAEMNAVLLAARNGISVKGAAIYVVALRRSDCENWGGPPCTRCAVELIQAGIKRCIFRPRRGDPGRWLTDKLEDGTSLTPESFFEEAGVELLEVGP